MLDTKKPDDSPFLKKMLSNRSLIFPNYKWVIGEGVNVDIFRGNWIPNLDHPPDLVNTQNLNLGRVSDLST